MVWQDSLSRLEASFLWKSDEGGKSMMKGLKMSSTSGDIRGWTSKVIESVGTAAKVGNQTIIDGWLTIEEELVWHEKTNTEEAKDTSIGTALDEVAVEHGGQERKRQKPKGPRRDEGFKPTGQMIVETLEDRDCISVRGKGTEGDQKRYVRVIKEWLWIMRLQS